MFKSVFTKYITAFMLIIAVSFMLLAVALSIIFICKDMGWNFGEMFSSVGSALNENAFVVGNGRPKLTASIPVSGAYAQVIKYTTMPNGEKAIKYQVVRV